MRAIPVAADKDTPGNPIASMVDIAFLLLIFFLVATTIRPIERDLSMKLPSPGVKPVIAGEPVLVTLEADGSLRWGEGTGAMLLADPEEGAGRSRFHEMLMITVEAWGDQQPGVMLKVADEVDQQRFIEVLDAFAFCGIENVGLLD
jgi:biopolymer transport protein ExbD